MYCVAVARRSYRFLFNGSFPLSFSDYWVAYTNYPLFLSENTFLPSLNNELNPANATCVRPCADVVDAPS